MAVHIDEIIRALRLAGHEVIVSAPAEPRGGGEFGSDSATVTMLRERLPAFVHELLEFAYSLLDFLKLSSAILKHRPDCIYERYNLFLPSGIWARSLFRLPLLLEVNSPLFQERCRHNGLVLRRLARWTQNYVWRRADYVLPVTRVLAGLVADAGVPEDRIVVIPNGIRRTQFVQTIDGLPVRKHLELGDKIVLGFTGFVRQWHGMDRVIDILAEYPQYPLHLLLVGDGPVRESLEQQATQLGIRDRVTFTGVVQRDDIPGYVASFDIALQPDVVAYASPLKLFEYMALGKPVVAPDEPNIREVLEHEKDALLFDNRDPASFRREVVRLCTDPELRRKIGDGARQKLEKRQFFWETNADKIVALFSELGVRQKS